MLKRSAAVHCSHQQEGDVGEESRSQHQQHHRPREPEAQVPEVKPAEIKHRLEERIHFMAYIKSINESIQPRSFSGIGGIPI